MNTSRVQLRSSITVDGKNIRLTAGVSLWTRFSAIYFRTVSRNCLIYHTSYNDFFEVLYHRNGDYHQILKRSFDQLNFLNVNHVTNHSSSSLVKSPSVTVGHKYVNVLRHQLLISSKINNGWSMAVTVLQRIAIASNKIGLLLVPTIKGARPYIH